MVDANPLFLYVYEDEVAGERVFIARSLTTGHVTMGWTREQALKCIVLTVHWNLKHAVEERGLTKEQWFRSQELDRGEFALRWMEAAKTRGIETRVFRDPSYLALVGAA